MNIFLDNIVFTIQKAGSKSVYWYELIQRLCHIKASLTFLNAHYDSGNIYEQRIDYRRFNCIREISNIPERFRRYLPMRYPLPAGSIYHAGYTRVSPQKDVVNILTVHDFAHERKLATRFPRRLANKTQKAYGIKSADGIICISDSTRRELLHFFPRTNPEKITVIHHGISEDFYPLNTHRQQHWKLPFELPEKYILYVGGRKSYKNFFIATETMQQLPDQYKLVLAGGETWDKKELSRLAATIPGRYLILPTVSPSQLNYLYNHAFSLLYPSTYEGFGFPPGEAMKAGCPVVTTNLTAMPEVVGKAGLLVNQPNAIDFAQQILRLENEPFRQNLIQLGYLQATRFTWENCLSETIHFYKSCWERKFVK